MATVDILTVTVAAFAVAGTGAAWHGWRRAQRAEATAATLEEQLRAAHHAAHHDPLTGLPNRRAFWRVGTELLADPAQLPMVAVLIDLDDFKRVNDTFGHAVGDQVLSTLARRLELYASGNIVARLGGDEFAALLSHDESSGRRARPDTCELGAILATPMCIAGNEVMVTASIGLAVVHTLANLTQVMGEADAAMYRAKTLRRETTGTPQALAITGRHEDGRSHAADIRPGLSGRLHSGAWTPVQHPASILIPAQPQGDGHASP
jgi:diguanylate cyclase